MKRHSGEHRGSTLLERLDLGGGECAAHEATPAAAGLGGPRGRPAGADVRPGFRSIRQGTGVAAGSGGRQPRYPGESGFLEFRHFDPDLARVREQSDQAVEARELAADAQHARGHSRAGKRIDAIQNPHGERKQGAADQIIGTRTWVDGGIDRSGLGSPPGRGQTGERG